MKLRLIPLQEPTIHFSLSFADLPQNVNTPPAWSNQLSHLIVEELEVPNMHALDKAAGITTLLEEVIFDVKRQEVRCRFVDGATEEWVFHSSEMVVDAEGIFHAVEGRNLLAVLEGIVRDVRASTQEDERAILEREKERQQVVRLERSKSVTVKRGNGKLLKHRKQRSMFMQLFSSIGSTIANLTSSPTSTSLLSHRHSTSLCTAPAHTNLGQDHPSQPHTAETSPKARALRRAARAALVDAFRRFVLGELTRRLPAFSSRDASGNYQDVHGGGFCVWILHSMRRRAQERVNQLFEEAQIAMVEQLPRHTSAPEDEQVLEQTSRDQVQPHSETEIPDHFDQTMTIVPPTFDEDEDETVTETDGSSLHTPSSVSHFNCLLVRPPTSASSHSHVPSASNMEAECQQPVQELYPTTPSPPVTPVPPRSPTSPTFTNLPSSSSPDRIPSPIPTSPSRPISSMLSQNLTGAAFLEYNKLMDLRERLWQLIMFAESQNRIAAEDLRNRLEVLTVRSRRRAWSAGSFRVGCGGRARSCQANVGFSLQTQYGFAMPCKSSPLARFSWTAEDLMREDEAELEPSSSRGIVSPVAEFPSYLQTSYLDIENIHLEDEEAESSRPLLHGEFEPYQEFPGPSPIDLRGRRGRRNPCRWRDIQEMGVGGGCVRRLFPVSEELENEGEEAVDLEFRIALGGGIAGYGPVRGRRMEKKGLFMGCDNIAAGGVEEERLGESQETLVDQIDDGLVDSRELDIDLGFGFDFHEKGGGNGFLGHADDESLFDHDDDEEEDEEDEDEFKFDLSSQLERPKIRPRVRTSSIFLPKGVVGQSLKNYTTPGSRTAGFLSQPVNFASSSYNLPLYTPLSKSAPSVFTPRSIHAVAPQVLASQPVLNISKVTTSNRSFEPELAEIEIRLVDEHTTAPYSSPHLLNPHRGQDSTDFWGHPMKSLPDLPMHVPLEIGVHDDGPEEFTLAMDLPRSVSGGVEGNSVNSGLMGKKWMRHAQANPARSLRLLDVHPSFVPSC